MKIITTMAQIVVTHICGLRFRLPRIFSCSNQTQPAQKKKICNDVMSYSQRLQQRSYLDSDDSDTKKSSLALRLEIVQIYSDRPSLAQDSQSQAQQTDYQYNQARLWYL